MAAVMIENRQKVAPVVEELNEVVERATDMLLFREFEDCHKTCLRGITRARHFTEDQGVCDSLETLCVLSIQALAEMDRWQEVLPFLQDVYTNIELCPSAVIQLSILLHAKVKEYSQCHALASIWLRHKDNSFKPGYDRVAALYIEHVMLPQGRAILAMQFLNSCTLLSENAKDNIIKYIETVRLKNSEKVSNKESASVNDIEETDKDPDVNIEDSKQSNDSESQLFKHIKYIGSVLASKLSFPTMDSLWKMASVLVGFCLLVRLAFNGELMTYLPQAKEAWSAMLKTLQTLFSPYRPGR